MNILLISYNWLPNNNVGVKRAVKFAKYLERAGHNIYVITAEKNAESIDGYANIKVFSIPCISSLEIVKNIINIFRKSNSNSHNEKKTKTSISNRKIKKNSILKELLFFPDIYFPWYFKIKNILFDILRYYKIEMVIATSPPITTHFIANMIKRKTNIPVILDIRDPWAFYPWEKTGYFFFIIRAVRFIFEYILIKNSKAISIVSYYWNNWYRNTFSFSYICTIFNCFYSNFKNTDNKSLVNNTKKLTLIYTGKVHNYKQNPINLFIALSELINEGKIDKDRIFVKFFTYGYYSADIISLAKKYKLNDIIKNFGMISYNKVLEEISDSDVCIMFGWNDKDDLIGKGAMPVKFYDYLMFRKPILLINADRQSELYNILKKTGLGYIAFEKDDLKKAILQIYNKFIKGEELVANSNDFFIEKFSCDYQISYKLNKIINKLIKK